MQKYYVAYNYYGDTPSGRLVGSSGVVLNCEPLITTKAVLELTDRLRTVAQKKHHVDNIEVIILNWKELND
jgi:hypothetical protein